MASSETTPSAEATPTGVLLSLVIAILAPMFLAAAGGDIKLAQYAAIEAIDEYRATHQRGLLAIAQIIAFGLAALDSLSRSMQDDMPVNAAVRLRGNANALSRTGELNRRALPMREAGPIALSAEDEYLEQSAIAGAEASREAVRRATDAVTQPEPAPPPVPVPEPAVPQTPAPPPPTPQRPAPGPQPSAIAMPPRDAERQHRTAWASAISDVAGEFTASLPFLPPAERKLTTRKIAAMSTSVTALLSGDPLPRSTRGILGPLLRPT